MSMFFLAANTDADADADTDINMGNDPPPLVNIQPQAQQAQSRYTIPRIAPLESYLESQDQIYTGNSSAKGARLHPNESIVLSHTFDKSLAIHRNSPPFDILHTVQGAHTHSISGAIWFPDGSGLFSWANDELLKTWTPELEHVQTLKGHTSHVRMAHTSPLCYTKAAYILSVGADHLTKIWTRPGGWGGDEDWEVLKTFEHHRSSIWCCTFSQRDGEQFATGGMDHKIHVYNTNNGNPIHVHMLTGHTHYVMSLDFNRQNGLLISAGGHDRTVRVWNTQQSAPKLVHTIIDAHYKAAVSSAQWYPDGSLLLSISRDEMLKFWDINNYLCKNVLDHKRFHNSTNLKITADGFYMLGGNMDKTIRKLILPFSIFSILIKFVFYKKFQTVDLLFDGDDKTIYPASLNEKVMAGESEEEAARRKMRDRVKTRKDKFFYLINIMLEDGGDNVVGKIFSFIHPKKKEVAISKATKNISSINDSKRLKRIKNRRKVVKKTGDLHHCLEWEDNINSPCDHSTLLRPGGAMGPKEISAADIQAQFGAAIGAQAQGIIHHY